MTSHILWQNAAKDVTLIDIPRSIVEAQGFNSPDDYDLLSSEPREAPYPSSEPKSAAAKAKSAGNTVDEPLHAEYRELLTHALGEVRRHHSGDWCLPRWFVEAGKPPKRKRKLDAADDTDLLEKRGSDGAPETPSTAKGLPDHFLSSLARALPPGGKAQLGLTATPMATGRFEDVRSNDPHFHSNGRDIPIVLSSAPKNDEDDTDVFKFNIPAKSSFHLGDCSASLEFRKAIREHALQQGSRPNFDFILLDPPWPNRSIKRTHKTAGATYNTIPTLEELGDLIFDMQLDSMLAEHALVGLWITNKQAVRELVLGLGGFFESWDVELVEEWIWLKTTTSGEPTSVLDALWKKPYEVLLLGCKRGKDANEGQPKPAVKRRVIIGVPDLHSRKPCLKSLIKPLMPDPRDFAALEIFARHLVTGWCSWGDECIKFNWEGYWRKREEV